MQKKSSTPVLASFATLKSLSDEKKYKSPYQLLKEFIIYIIVEDTLYTFTAIEMKNKLNERFGFSIPESVIRTSLKNMDAVSLNNGIYSVCHWKLENDSLFEIKKKEADDSESCITQSLLEYISNKVGSSFVDEDKVTNDLAHFLTEDQSFYSGEYTDLISEFVLKYEYDEKIQNGLDNIRQGSILYMGLSHNISEVGSIKKPLTLYLCTEILFSLVGYNGEIYHQLANDFFEQVRSANFAKTGTITLRYFSETKNEIDEFFGTACEIVEGRREFLLNKPAMSKIIDGCITSADVNVEKSDFYYKLKSDYGIIEDSHDNYYEESRYLTNLEDNRYDSDDDQEKLEAAQKFVSHINKLRDGKHYWSDIESEHLLVTNNRTILQVSKELTNDIKAVENIQYITPFAVSLDRITSLLWYKLGNGFTKKTFPSSVRAILKARTVLSSSIAKKAEESFLEVKRDFEAGKLDEDQLASRILTLRDKPSLPEELQGDDIDNIMNFSPEYLRRYEEQYKETQKNLEEKEEMIESLKADAAKKLSESNATVAEKEQIIKDKDEENSKLKSEVEAYRRKETNEANRKEKNRNILKFIWSIISKLLLIALLAIAVVYVEIKLECRALSIIISIAELYTTFKSVVTVCKKDYCKYIKNEQE